MKKTTKLIIGIIIVFVILIIIIATIFVILKRNEKKEVIQDYSSNNVDYISNNLSVHFIDVGQGDSELIITPNNKVILIDCGDNNKGDLVVDYLKSKKIESIDVLIATHPDADHIGGCDNVLENFEVLNVYDDGLSKDTMTFNEYINLAKKTNYHALNQDLFLELDDSVNIQLLVAYDTAGVFDDVNEDSVVVKMVYKNSSFLFAADCETDCEKTLVDTADLDVDVLKVGHHGSRTSSTPIFLSEVTPEISIISVDVVNRYGHPHQETLDRLSKTNLLTTEEKGDIIITTNGNDYTVETSK